MTLRDQLLQNVTPLPNGAATANSAGIDMQHGPRGHNVAEVELSLDAPALTTVELADTQTITYVFQGSDTANFASPVNLCTVGVQTGAGGAGAPAQNFRFRLPRTSYRYVRATAVKAGASNASTKSMTLVALF